MTRPLPEIRPSNRLSMVQVIGVKTDTRKHHEIAQEYGISRSYVCKIKNGTRIKVANGVLDLTIAVPQQTALSGLL